MHLDTIIFLEATQVFDASSDGYTKGEGLWQHRGGF